MLFTKIWTAVLAVLATACLAGMYLLSTGSSGGFSDADEVAVRAVTEAGMAALASDVNSSPVSLAPSLLADPRLKAALDGGEAPAGEDGDEAPSLKDVFDDVAYQGLLNSDSLMSLAVVDKGGTVLVRTGAAPEDFDELDRIAGLSSALASDDSTLMSATLGGQLHAVNISRPLGEAQSRRLVAIRPVELGGGSFFRRVVGTENPAGLIRDGKLIGDAIGGAKAAELAAALETHLAEIPSEGASAAFVVGEGSDARLGAAARVPGPAGKGKSGSFFVVLSSSTAGASQQDMAAALSSALASGGLAQLNWVLVIGLLAISLGLTFYVVHIEFNAPMRRLAGEFQAIAEGRQHDLNHDVYGSEYSRIARAAATTMEALRMSWEQELVEGEDEGVETTPSRRTRNTRGVRATRGQRRTRGRTRGNPSLAAEAAADRLDGDDEAIDLPDAEPSPASSIPAPPVEAAPVDAPTFSDELEPQVGTALADESDSVSLADAADEREVYFRAIYDEFVETKLACGEATEGFTFDKFARKLRKQSESLLARPDVKDVEFSVYVKDGKAALRAKVVKH